MKKIKFSIIALFVAAAAFTSCDGEIDPTTIAAPVITFTEGDATIDEGTAVSISGSIFAEGELDQVVIKQNVDGTITTLSDDNSFDVNTSHDFVFDFTDVTESFSITVEATDKEDQTRSATATITVTLYETITEHTVVLGDIGDSEGSFLDLTENYVYTISTGDDYAEDNQEVIDVFYFYGATGFASFYSPQGAVDAQLNSFANLSSWTTLNTTKFKLDNTADYANIDFAGLSAGIDGVTDQSVTALADGDLVFFKTDDGKCGLINVGTVVAQEKGVLEITFSYKIQDNVPVVK